MPASKPKTSPSKSSRRVKQEPYKSFRLQKRIKHPGPSLPPARKLLWRSLGHLKQHWRLFGGITLLYLLLTVIFVKGLGSTQNVAELKVLAEQAFEDVGRGASLLTGIALFSFMLTSAGTTPDDAAGAYQTILLIVVSLVIIWALRQSHAGTKVSIRDAYYKGPYPIVPFILVLGVIVLQLLPLVVVGLLYNIMFTSGVAITGLEQVLWALLLSLLVLFSMYMLTSSLFALYIVTLPDMRPWQALRTARELVRFRRWTVMRKVFFMPPALILLGAIIMLPVIIYMTAAAEWVFFALNMSGIAVVHSYMYALYRELI